VVCGLAFATKFGGAYAGARIAGEPNRSALILGVCMNTRALMELVAINIGYEMGVLPRSMFTKLVIMAILSTLVATPLIRWLMRGEELSPLSVRRQWRRRRSHIVLDRGPLSWMARKMNCWKPWRFGRPAASADRSSPSVAAPVETGSL